MLEGALALEKVVFVREFHSPIGAKDNGARDLDEACVTAVARAFHAH